MNVKTTQVQKCISWFLYKIHFITTKNTSQGFIAHQHCSTIGNNCLQKASVHEINWTLIHLKIHQIHFRLSGVDKQMSTLYNLQNSPKAFGSLLGVLKAVHKEFYNRHILQVWKSYILMRMGFSILILKNMAACFHHILVLLRSIWQLINYLSWIVASPISAFPNEFYQLWWLLHLQVENPNG